MRGHGHYDTSHHPVEHRHRRGWLYHEHHRRALRGYRATRHRLNGSHRSHKVTLSLGNALAAVVILGIVGALAFLVGRLLT
ncbi:hypothetical protein LCGC14_3087030 [marine sediment metagenome]|uniref:Uncharacterized protein n=1 Tax=marine sediment metagenome TaxID=412755 RepID=A0A0F8X090_9ZZZZ